MRERKSITGQEDGRKIVTVFFSSVGNELVKEKSG